MSNVNNAIFRVDVERELIYKNNMIVTSIDDLSDIEIESTMSHLGLFSVEQFCSIFSIDIQDYCLEENEENEEDPAEDWCDRYWFEDPTYDYDDIDDIDDNIDYR